jgi:hypothetical protein
MLYRQYSSSAGHGRCPASGKVCFPSHSDASRALAQIAATAVADPIPTRDYRCPDCQRWHLTKRVPW